MATARQGQRRGGVPPLSPHPKPPITVEEWEAKAPLGELETRSVTVLKATIEKIPFPSKFTSDEAAASRSSTPTSRYRLGPTPGSRPATPNQQQTRPLAAHALHPKQPVQTPQQFYDWFSLIDRSVAHSQEAHFRAHVASVAQQLESCDRLIDGIDEVDREVGEMLEGWSGVEEGGRSLKNACERLLEERDGLLTLTEEIDARLEYFQELEHATRLLNYPGESLVLQTDFLYMVERVDICIGYLKDHRHFREAEVYLLRFQQCMTRAMTLIKMYFVASLRALTADVARRLSEKDVSVTAQMHLLYTRFKSVAPQLAPLIGELERRAQTYPEDLSSLLSECRSAYFTARKSLLIGRLTEEIKGLDPTRTDLVELTRAGCTYLKQLCTDEFNLFKEFFNSGESQLYEYLENICDYLYDDLRPRILHEPRLTALCDVCTVLQALMVLDISSVPDSPSSEEGRSLEDELTMDLDKPRKNGLARLHLSNLLQMVLQDAQTRLFFKAQAVIQSEIRSYVAKPEDLAYPQKLIEAGKPSTGFEIREKQSTSHLFALPSMDRQETWYPTLRKTVWVLSQLHDFVKPAIFEDLAQEAINLCRTSLVSASENLAKRNPPSSVLDGHLFLVRHLLVLKEMVHGLDFVPKDSESKAGVVTDTLSSVLNKTTSLFPNVLFTSLGMPSKDESIADAGHGIDHDLKRGCENIILECSGLICGRIRQWVDAARPQGHSAQAGSPLAPAQPGPEELDKGFRLACEQDLRALVAKLRLYLADDRTTSVLLIHIQDKITEEYDSFRDAVRGTQGGSLRYNLLSQTELKELLRSVCGGYGGR